jgi:hypothetical protein
MQIAERSVGSSNDERYLNQNTDPAYADLRTALSTSVLPSDQIAPGTL